MNVNKPIWYSSDVSRNINVPSNKDKKISINNFHYENEIYKFKKSKNKFDIAQLKNNNKKELNNLNESKNKAINTINNKNITDEKKKIGIKSINTIYDKKISNLDKTSICIKWKLSFSIEQEKILLKYFDECNKLYNTCVDIYNENNSYFDKKYTDIKLNVFKTIYKKDKPAPYDTLTDEVRIFCSNLKSCNTNVKNGHQKHFKMSYIKSKNYKSILVSKKGVSEKGIFPNLLKPNKKKI